MGRRSYSTKRSAPGLIFTYAKPRSSQEDFWSKVNSKNNLDDENPFIIVYNFLKEHPKYEACKEHVNLKLISYILSRHIINFDLTQEEFDIISNITPVRLELPVLDKDDLVKLVGKYVRKGEMGVAGAYIFNNKTNGYCYVGSSMFLANRLSTGYLPLN